MCQPAVMDRDATHVETLIGHIKSSMTNTFDLTAHPGVLLNIATGLQVYPAKCTHKRAGNNGVIYLFEVQKKRFHAPISMSKFFERLLLSKQSRQSSRHHDTECNQHPRNVFSVSSDIYRSLR